MSAQLPEDDQLIADVCKVTEIQRLKLTVTKSVKGSIIIGGSAFTGALVFGPVGFIIGAGLSSVYCYITSAGSFNSVPHILVNLTEEEKIHLGNQIRELLTIENVASVAALVTSRNGVIGLIDLVRVFLKQVRSIDVAA